MKVKLKHTPQLLVCISILPSKMVKVSKRIAAVLLCLATFTSAQNVCPPAEILSPCRCTESSRTIECSNIAGRFSIKEIFDNVSPLIDEQVVFDKLIISSTSLIEIPSKAIEFLKFVEIEIVDNTNLEYIYKDSLESTVNITKSLILYSNHLTNIGDEERDLYDFVNQFINLETLSICRNALTSVPLNAFDALVNLKTLQFLEDANEIPSGALNLPSLTSLLMSYGRIKGIPDYGFGDLPSLEELEMEYGALTYIGKEAFAGYPKLGRTRLRSNFVGSNDFHPDAFKGVSDVMRIDLQFNTFGYLREDVFKPLLDSAEIVYVGGQHCSISGCSNYYFDCDERIDWVCANATYYETVLNGVRCRGIDGYVWKYCDSLIE